MQSDEILFAFKKQSQVARAPSKAVRRPLMKVQKSLVLNFLRYLMTVADTELRLKSTITLCFDVSWSSLVAMCGKVPGSTYLCSKCRKNKTRLSEENHC